MLKRNKFNPEIIDKIKREELSVVICMTGPEPEIPHLKVSLGECCSCQGMVHFEAANAELIKTSGMSLLCYLCVIESELMPEVMAHFRAKEIKSFVGGAELDFDQADAAVSQMVKPKPKGEES